MGTVACYLDTSILVALLTPEPFTGRADRFLRQNTEQLLVSDFAGAEFSSAMARRVRMREFTTEQAEAAFSGFDAWLDRVADQVEMTTGDVLLAMSYIRRLDLALRTPDALHLAIARRLDATLVTFDRAMAAAARALGMAVVLP